MRPPRVRPATATPTGPTLPAVPRSVYADLDGAADVYVAVESYLRTATNEPSRREDVTAWESWRDLWWDPISDETERLSVGS